MNIAFHGTGGLNTNRRTTSATINGIRFECGDYYAADGIPSIVVVSHHSPRCIGGLERLGRHCLDGGKSPLALIAPPESVPHIRQALSALSEDLGSGGCPENVFRFIQPDNTSADGKICDFHVENGLLTFLENGRGPKPILLSVSDKTMIWAPWARGVPTRSDFGMTSDECDYYVCRGGKPLEAIKSGEMLFAKAEFERMYIVGAPDGYEFNFLEDFEDVKPEHLDILNRRYSLGR